MRIAFLLFPMLALSVEAADTNDLAARRLYYQDNAPEVVFKATTVAQKPAAKPSAVVQKPINTVAQTATATATVSKAQQIEKIQQALRAAATTALNSSGGGPSLKPASNLGVRYNVLKVNQDTNLRTEVSPDTVFHEKDCVAVRIQPNRGGFLYVFAEESSGRFRPLIPSEEAAEDSNIVRAYNLMDVPQNYCFEMDDKPGTERLVFVVTDKPEDIMKLNDTLKPADGGPRRGDSYVVAENDLNSITGGLQGRDLKITRVGNKPAVGEAPYSTYLVNAAATTSDRLVLEVKLKHGK